MRDSPGHRMAVASPVWVSGWDRTRLDLLGAQAHSSTALALGPPEVSLARTPLAARTASLAESLYCHFQWTEQSAQ